MNQGKTVFSQLMDFAPIYSFHQCVEKYHGEKWVQSFSCWEQFLSMAFAQLTSRRGLRDIEISLEAYRRDCADLLVIGNYYVCRNGDDLYSRR
jgi:hypothetical protein